MNHPSHSSTQSAAVRRSAFLQIAALALCPALAVAELSAQSGGPSGLGGAEGAEAPPSSVALSDVTLTYSFSSAGDIERNGKLGAAKTGQYEFAASFSLPAPKTWRFSSALSWKRYEFDLTGAVPLPDKLEKIGLNFIAMKDLSTEIGPGWSAMLMLSPSFASDTLKLSGDSFSLMGLASIGKEVSPTFSWSAGIVGVSRGDMTVFPMLGLRWAFAPDWSLEVGFPRTAVSYQVNDALSLNVGARFIGGTYYVADAPAAGLGKTYLDYQEIRVGLGAEYQIGKSLSVVVDGGITASRSYDYYDRDVKLDGQSTAYGSLSLRYRF